MPPYVYVMYCSRFGEVANVKEQAQGKWIVRFLDKDSKWTNLL